LPEALFALPTLIQFFDLFGTMAFAVTGAFKAIEHKFDIVGIIILSTITGVAGGIIRDIALSSIPPNAVVNPLYIIVTVSVAVISFFVYPSLKKYLDLLLKFDAIGLGVFTIIGATIAYNLFGLDFLAMAFAGVLTAIGGGILRDVFVNEIPIVFVKELYASTSFIGIIIFFAMLSSGISLDLAVLPSIGTVTGIRLIAMKYNWNLPRARNN
jgi:uncharacterized membrane protein YeiH